MGRIGRPDSFYPMSLVWTWVWCQPSVRIDSTRVEFCRLGYLYTSTYSFFYWQQNSVTQNLTKQCAVMIPFSIDSVHISPFLFRDSRAVSFYGKSHTKRDCRHTHTICTLLKIFRYMYDKYKETLNHPKKDELPF